MRTLLQSSPGGGRVTDSRETQGRDEKLSVMVRGRLDTSMEGLSNLPESKEAFAGRAPQERRDLGDRDKKEDAIKGVLKGQTGVI